MGSCDVFWGSHGCSLDTGHEGDHRCVDFGETEPCMAIGRDGKDASGFQWLLYGEDAPTAEGRGE